MIVKSGLDFFLFPPCKKKVIFVTNFGQKPSFFEVEVSGNNFPHGGISKLFFLDHFFSPKLVILKQIAF